MPNSQKSARPSSPATMVTAQLILRRIKGRAALTRFMPIAAISPFITSAELSSAANVEIFHHQHAII